MTTAVVTLAEQFRRFHLPVSESEQAEIRELAKLIEKYHQDYLRVLNGATERIAERLENLERELTGSARDREGSVLDRLSMVESQLYRFEKDCAKIEKNEQAIARYKNVLAGLGIASGVIVFLLIYIFTQLAP